MKSLRKMSDRGSRHGDSLLESRCSDDARIESRYRRDVHKASVSGDAPNVSEARVASGHVRNCRIHSTQAGAAECLGASVERPAMRACSRSSPGRMPN